MPHYYFNLCNGEGLLLDPEGLEYADDETAFDNASTMIRALVAAEIQEGKVVDLGHYIAVHSEGAELRRVHFADVVKIKQRA